MIQSKLILINFFRNCLIEDDADGCVLLRDFFNQRGLRIGLQTLNRLPIVYLLLSINNIHVHVMRNAQRVARSSNRSVQRLGLSNSKMYERDHV